MSRSEGQVDWRLMDGTLHVWARPPGGAATATTRGISPDMSFLEMLDVVNERLIEKDEEPIAFDHDCREGICGSAR